MLCPTLPPPCSCALGERGTQSPSALLRLWLDGYLEPGSFHVTYNAATGLIMAKKINKQLNKLKKSKKKVQNVHFVYINIDQHL